IALLVNVLLIKAYTSQGHGSDGLKTPHANGDSVPAAVREGGPVLDPQNGQPKSYAMPSRTIALTFDDGPDPTWTPQVLRALRKYQINATFFMVGTEVARHPALGKGAVKAGKERGPPPSPPPNLAATPGGRPTLKYPQTKMATAAATDKSTKLLRPPYSSLPGAIDHDGWDTILDAKR